MVEITRPLNLDTRQEALVDMHSFLNVLNVLASEMDLLDYALGGSPPLQEVLSLVHEMARGLGDAEQVQAWLADPGELRARILRGVETTAKDAPPTLELQESVENIQSILEVFEVRARELAARHSHALAWTWFRLEELETRFTHLFQAIERNSKGRFRIICNIADQEPRDYLVKLDLSSVDGDRIRIPAVFQDVIRDLLANARKYTPPGGRILAGLRDSGEEVRFVVEDSGMGIPEHQIQDVVEFGFRADNVRDRRTQGGGFGLTKAYWVTRKCGGRMWIDSAEGLGTRICIHLPRPRAT